jgi:hypothetical protein
MTSSPDSVAPSMRSRVVELIPGEHYVVFTDSGDALPDEDVIEELKILAYAHRKKETLGPGTTQVIATLAEAVAEGIVTNVIWAGCQEAKAYVVKLRSRRREHLREAEEAARHALEAIQAPQIPVAAPAAATEIQASGMGTGWNASYKSAGKMVEFYMDGSGNVIDVTISTRP